MRKVCSKCGIEKEVGEFSRDKSKKDGCNRVCKACEKARYAANSEQFKARSKARYDANPDAMKARNKAWLVANAEAVAVRKKAWHEANSEAVNARSREYYEANLEAVKARHKAYYAANLEAERAGNKAYCKALPDPYIKAILKQSGTPNPPPELIDLKREIIATKRVRKPKKQALKQITDMINKKENKNDE